MNTIQEETISKVQSLAQSLIEHMGIDGQVHAVKADDETINIAIETEDTGLLIGYHGETINAVQRVLSMMVFKQLGDWVRVVTNVGDYREKREETVKSLALRIAQEVALTKRPVPLPFLVPFERRIVHMILADHPDVVSESEGEGRERRIIVKPRQAD